MVASGEVEITEIHGVRQPATDPYIRHIVKLIHSGLFTEPIAQASLREELLECIDDFWTDEETYNAHWAGELVE